ncbi:MAG: signal peptidase I [Kiritimatiellae bacterium]|nr:signal peptidase I [Kiritimatiellia bacterium]
MQNPALPVILSVVLDAAALYARWTLVRRVALGRAGAMRRTMRLAERDLNVFMRSFEDAMPSDRRTALAGALAELRGARKSRVPEEEARKALENARAAASEAEATLNVRHVPAPLRETVETIVVAFGVALTVRAYFLQPFKIPTGSMQPTLYGIHAIDSAEPDVFDRFMPLKVAKWAVTGRWYRDVVAHRDGSLAIWSDHKNAPGYVLASLAGETYKIPQDAMERHENDLLRFSDLRPDDPMHPGAGPLRGSVRKGDRIWSGYVVAGDQVFVNRFLWYLRPPKRDEIVVFATSATTLADSASRTTGGNAGRPGSRILPVPFFGMTLALEETPIPGLSPGMFYIKRLVGLPGERVGIDPPFLTVDGERVSGFRGIDRESAMGASRSGPNYAGYHLTGDEALGRNRNPNYPLGQPGAAIRVGDAYLPMGDNTRNSFDGRYWGAVPRPQMLGPAACVYWPLSVRWGRVW